MKRLLREPLLHFLVIGGLLVAVDRLVREDDRAIVVTRAVRSDASRRFRDELGRAPTPSEEEQRLKGWLRDEALYRQALREGLDKGDASVRRILIDKVRAKALLEVAERQPSAAELDDWLAKHRTDYEAPLRYAVEWLTFTGPEAAAARKQVLARIEAGVEPRSLGVPLFGASLTGEQLKERLGESVATRVSSLALGRWESVEGAGGLLLLRLSRVSGGLPEPTELAPRLREDWSRARREREAEQVLDGIARRYRVEVKD